MFLAAQGARTARRAADVLERAETLISRVDDPELPAWVLAARGMSAFMAGEFARSCVFNEAAVQILRNDCTGVLWQVGGVDVQVVWALFYRGRLAEFARRVDAGVEAARVRGNRFDAANFGSGVAALAWAVADRTTHGRSAVAQAVEAWTTRSFHLQHYYSLLALASFDLYDGDDAYARIERTWPALQRSHLMMCQSIVIEAHHLRARAAIVRGCDAPIREAQRALASLSGLRWADAMTALITAGACRDRERAASELATAEELCTRAELAGFAACALRRRGELLGNEALVRRADVMLRAERVAAPDRFARMLVPIRAEAR
jgi:hypothetical protein